MIGIIWCLVGVVLLAFYNALLVLDDKTPENDLINKEIETEWHVVGAAIFCYIAITAWMIWGVEYIPFVLSAFWLIYGGIVHVIGLKKPFFFVGTTAKTDIVIRKIFPKNPENGSAFLKCLVMILSVLLLIFI